MDELLKAITQLINTGGALAAPALYLFFVYKVISAAVIPLSVYAGLRGAVLCIHAIGNAHAQNKRLDMGKRLLYFAEKYNNKSEADVEKSWPEMYKVLLRG